MAKKVNIVDIFTKNGGGYSVGDQGGVREGHALIERIIFEEHGYNKGRQGKFPAYIVFYEGSGFRRVVPQDQVTGMAVEMTEEDDVVPEVAPELPGE